MKMMKSTATENKDERLVKIGTKVRQLRKSHPEFLNYEVFAFTHKINKGTIQRIERGDSFNMDSLLKVLDALDVKLATFFADLD
jgi:transcriptional regulator with XRE-family HTH domain